MIKTWRVVALNPVIGVVEDDRYGTLTDARTFAPPYPYVVYHWEHNESEGRFDWKLVEVRAHW